MPARRLAAAPQLLALAMVAALLAACSSDSVTRPTTTGNIELMARFDSVLVALGPDQGARSTQLSALITLLGLGAPVQSVSVSIDGNAATYSAVGGYEVSDDVEGHPSDSVYAVLAWRGDHADTLALVLIFQDLVDASLTTSDSAFQSTTGSGSVTAAAPNGTCTSYVDHLPTGITIPPGLTCQLETATPSADVQVASSDAQPVTHHLVLPSQSVPGIRIEGQTGP
ncbi:MAG TPA: hypothetical protein VIC55_01665 [Gemmatimonadaceae bacterium]|jgi:hypothetical protein